MDVAQKAKYTKYITDLLTNDAAEKAAAPTKPSPGPVEKVDFLIEENSTKHHTENYRLVQIGTPIFRRGQPFEIKIAFKENFVISEGNLRLDFITGLGEDQSTLVHLNVPVLVSEKFPVKEGWSVRMKEKQPKTLTLEVKIPPTCPIGVWRLVVVHLPGKIIYASNQHFYIICNPWCEDDVVYVLSEDYIYEYVLEEEGAFFRGEQQHPYTHNWNYNQFFESTLPAAVYLLETWAERSIFSDVVKVAQYFGYYIRKSVIEENWTGKYEKNTDPTKGKNTYHILKPFMETKQKVKYGQCFTFAAVACSLFRALGIPCRVATGYNIAIEKKPIDLICKVKIVENVKGKPNQVDEKGFDQYWNYHLWNEIWIYRPDLQNEDYNGWQVIDATGAYGPLPLKALKEGDVTMNNYHLLLIFSSINAYLQKHKVDKKTQKIAVQPIRSDFIGPVVFTKAFGTMENENITADYKYPDGTQEKLDSLKKVAEFSQGHELLKILQEAPVPIEENKDDLSFNVELESIMIGESIKVVVKVKNHSKDLRSCTLNIAADCVGYDGTYLESLNLSGYDDDYTYSKDISLEGGKDGMVTHTITPEMYIYLDNISEPIRFTFTAPVNETEQEWFDEVDIRIEKPLLNVQIPAADVKLQSIVKVTMSFKNPLQYKLTNCYFTIQACCLEEKEDFEFRDVKPLEEIKHTVEITAVRKGKCSISAYFESDHLNGLEGSTAIRIS